MTAKKLLLFSAMLVCQFVLAQADVTFKLKEVVVSDNNFKNFSKSQSVIVFNDSVLHKNQPLLTDLLKFNSVIYFKEYGRGMLSTVSFRGTTASQTAVVWNGININSQLNGSTDFNTISALDYNSVSVKAGGGSVLYGSGAVGGTVHLNTDLTFNQQSETILKLDYGSFNTTGINVKTTTSNAKWSSQVGFSKNTSTNDYEYKNLYTWRGEQRYNQNGQYDLTTLNANIGYKIKNNQILKLYSQTSKTDRNISLVSESETKTKYINGFSRNLLEYNIDFNKLNTNFKTAFVTEEYQYYGDINSNYFSFGKTESAITKLDVGYQLYKSIYIKGVVDYNHTKGFGTSFGSHIREITATSLLVKFNINKHWENDLGIRKEFSTNYSPPVLFSLGSSYNFSDLYTLKLNISQNYRIPTYNDLYWEVGGNPNLKPENAYQAEIGNVFTIKKITISQTFYYLKINDLLRWIPGDNGVWAPQNTNKVNSYGAETVLNWKKNYGENYFSASATYAYTVSKNIETNKQLFFVPYHKLTSALAYARDRFSVNYQFLYNGFVYTRSNNDPEQIINDFYISNIGIDYDFKLLNSFKFGFQVFNLFDEAYESLEDRPMPGRNFNMYLTLKF